MKRVIAITAICALAAPVALPLPARLYAAPVTLKIASQSPENTPIGTGLLKIASETKAASGGRVVIKVFQNSSQGDEESMRQKMRTGFIDGAVFDSFGLSHISPETISLCAPTLVESQDELAYVMKTAAPYIMKKIDEKGYKAVALTSIGWVRFFSRFPIATSADLRKHKIAVNPYETELIQLYKLAGLNVVLSPSTTLLQQLQSKSVDIFYNTPVYLSYQWSSYKAVGNYMTDLKVCPVVGGIVLRKQAWDSIPDDFKPQFLDIFSKAAKEIEVDFNKKEDTIVSELSKAGLNLVPVDAATDKIWRSDFEDAVQKGTGTVFTKDMVALIKQAKAEYKAGKR